MVAAIRCKVATKGIVDVVDSLAQLNLHVKHFNDEIKNDFLLQIHQNHKKPTQIVTATIRRVWPLELGV